MPRTYRRETWAKVARVRFELHRKIQIILNGLDEPEETPWIYDTTRGMSFKDEEADENDLSCRACYINIPKAAFRACGHKCLCLRCKHRIEEQARRANTHRESYSISYIIFKQPSIAIIEIRA